MNDSKDVAKINKAFLRNINNMLPHIVDPSVQTRYRTKPSNSALKYVVNKKNLK